MKAERQKRKLERPRVDTIDLMRRQAEAALLPDAQIKIKRGKHVSRVNRKVNP